MLCEQESTPRLDGDRALNSASERQRQKVTISRSPFPRHDAKDRSTARTGNTSITSLQSTPAPQDSLGFYSPRGQATNWEATFAMLIAKKGSLSRKFKELLPVKKKNSKNHEKDLCIRRNQNSQ